MGIYLTADCRGNIFQFIYIYIYIYSSPPFWETTLKNTENGVSWNGRSLMRSIFSSHKSKVGFLYSKCIYHGAGTQDTLLLLTIWFGLGNTSLGLRVVSPGDGGSLKGGLMYLSLTNFLCAEPRFKKTLTSFDCNVRWKRGPPNSCKFRYRNCLLTGLSLCDFCERMNGWNEL